MLQFALALLKGSAQPSTAASDAQTRHTCPPLPQQKPAAVHLQVSRAEYLLLLATFISILQLELEKGVAAGILLCTLYFAVTYARVSASWTELHSW